MAFSSIIRSQFPVIIKVLVRTNQTTQTRWGCVVLITEFLYLPVLSSDLGYHGIKVLVQDVNESPNSMELRRFITEFYGHLPAPSSDLGFHT
ncbi:hypothetical protein EVAR_87278_1 [Eumeta japonica]|uniref:Uncharacterized protein n=1 Tax=Eumeta variegata TaxID=151549 RepID=A0A4C1VXD4_EUMVA|nr:hypothetical protein EVAR_87278_1 [Eumeta japonica]